MRYAIFLLGLLIFLGCANDNEVQETQKNHPPFDLALSLDQISASFVTLTVTLVLDTGDYVVSPYTLQDFLGVFDMSILDSTDVQFVGG